MIENEKPMKKLTYLRDMELKEKLIIRLVGEPPTQRSWAPNQAAIVKNVIRRKQKFNEET